MDTNTFLENFDSITEVPGSVQRLRCYIRDLAVRGHLTRDMPRSGPENVAQENVDAVGYFQIPESWRWVRLADISTYIQRGKSPKYSIEPSTVKVVSQKSVQWSGFDAVPTRFLQSDAIGTYASDRFLQPNDLLWNSTGTGTVGRVALYVSNDTKQRSVADSHVTVVRLQDCIPRFVLFWLSSTYIQSRISSLTTGSTQQQELSTSTVRGIRVPLPPPGEQERIVSTLDELMALCDLLETGQTRRAELAQQLRRSSMQLPTGIDNYEELSAAWKRVSSSWNAIVDDIDSIEDARRMILDLVVSGQLVRQLPHEEVAERLLDRARSAREEMVAKSKTRVVADDLNYARTDPLPKGWSWAPLQDVVRFIDYRGRTPTKTTSGVPLITAKNIRRGFISETPREFVAETEFDRWMTRGLPRVGDVLFTTEAPMGNAAVVRSEERFALAQRTITLAPYADFDGEFLEMLLLSQWFGKELSKRATGMTATGIKAAKLRLIRIPVPPLGEQKRLVACAADLLEGCRELQQVIARRDTAGHDVGIALTSYQDVAPPPV
jgi:type I restriction enzyme S subunit